MPSEYIPREYIPHTKDVENCYIYALTGEYGGIGFPQARAEFNRWLDSVKTEAVYDYIRTKEIATVKITFENQPIFDDLIREKQAEAWDQGWGSADDYWDSGIVAPNPYKDSNV